MLYANTRTQARNIGETLNKINGHKVTKQARTKTDKGWPIPWVGGTLKAPAGALQRSLAKLPSTKRKQVWINKPSTGLIRVGIISEGTDYAF